MQSDNPTASILIIGDEILSGRTREGNAYYLAGVLNAHGIDLREMRVVSDDSDQIVAAIRALDASLGGAWDMVFTSGGIGPTHDDVTAEAVATAFGTTLEINERARAAMQDRYGALGLELTPNRLLMARVPVGAELIENKASAAPGFSIGRTHVMAGVPEVFRAMVDAVLPRLPTGRPSHALSVEVLRGESDVAEDFAELQKEYPDLSLGSYPFRRDSGYGTNLVVRGLDKDRVEAAMDELKRRLKL